MTVTQTGRNIALVGLMALLAALLPFATAAEAQGSGIRADMDINEDADVSDALQTSLLFTNVQFADGSGVPVVLATAEDGADALASGSLADDAAFLFYDGEVEQAHADEIARLGSTEVIVIGGEDRIPASAVDAVVAAGIAEENVTRLAGPARIETANEVAQYEYENDEDARMDAVHVSRAFGSDTPQQAFADAAGLGAWAAQSGVPTVLTTVNLGEDGTLADALEAFYTDVNPDNEISAPIGGDMAVGEDVESYLAETYDQTTPRSESEEFPERAGTAVAINEDRGLDAESCDPLAGIIFTDGYAGDFFIDAYALAGVAGTSNHAVLLTNGEADGLPPATVAYLDALPEDCVDEFFDVVTTPNVDDGDRDAIVEALGIDPLPAVQYEDVDTNATLTVTPTDEATLTFVEGTETDTSDNRAFSATDLDDDSVYRITLVDADNITVDSDGVYTFVPLDNDTDCEDEELIADPGTNGIATISSTTGGGTPTSRTIGGQVPVSGVINFTIDGEGFGSVYPVVYVDGEGDSDCTFLNVDESGSPLDPFGVGGLTNFDAPAAEAGDSGTVRVLATTESGFVGAPVADVSDPTSDATLSAARTFEYDATDIFTYDDGAAGTPELIGSVDGFESIVSFGDVITVDYDPQVAPLEDLNEFQVDADLLTVPGPNMSVGIDEDNVLTLDWGASSAGLLSGYQIGIAPDDSAEGDEVCTAVDTSGTVFGDGPYDDGDDNTSIDGTSGSVDLTDQLAADAIEDGTTLCVHVRAVSQTDDIGAANDAPDADSTTDWNAFSPFTVGEAVENDPATILDAVITDDVAPFGGPTDGDVFDLTFSEALDTPAAGDTITTTEAGGDTVTIECVDNDGDAPSNVLFTPATCDLGDSDDGDSDLVTVTLTDNAVESNAGATPVVPLFPLEITATTIGDGVSQTDIDGSDDTTIDLEA